MAKNLLLGEFLARLRGRITLARTYYSGAMARSPFGRRLLFIAFKVPSEAVPFWGAGGLPNWAQGFACTG